MATVDLDWSALDDTLSAKLVDLFNKHLATAKRPSFLGPVSVLGFEFGDSSPEVEVVDMQDIYPDFLIDDEDEDETHRQEPSAEEGVKHGHMGAAYNQPWSPPLRNLNQSNLFGPGGQSAWGSPDAGASSFVSPPPATFSSLPPDQSPTFSMQSSSKHPDIQLHLHITHHSNLRLSLSTALLINYPSPLFMSLPMKLSIVGLVFSGEFVVAYEGSRRRVHICIVDEQDPASFPLLGKKTTVEPMAQHDTSAKVPIGQRLLPDIFIESEIGQADKHVLKNVSKVERFIQDVMRKVVEDELVYPNFQTIVLNNNRDQAPS